MVNKSSGYVLAALALPALAIAAFGLSACGGTKSSSSGGGPPPTVKFTEPMDGALIALDFNPDHTELGGEVETTNFKVAAGDQGDGQVYIIVDGPQCNDHDQDGNRLSFNTTIPSLEADGPMDGKSFEAGILYCDDPLNHIEGMHTLIAELHHPDGTPVQVDGKTVSTSIQVTVQIATAGSDVDAGGG